MLRIANEYQRTVDYLVEEIIGEAEDLGSVQPFLWDRTRAIRNDFSIQQFKDLQSIKVSISCHERIARFHLLSTHQMTHPDVPAGEYSYQQDIEQLDKTFVTLRYMYEDNADVYRSPNEAEFRAYQILFSIHHHKPDVEAQWGRWPEEIRNDRRVQQAMRIYIAAQTVKMPQGPFRPFAGNPVAKAQWISFWRAVQSPFTSYLMACATERFFNYVREQVLKTIWECYRTREPSKKTIEWSYQDLTEALGFDDEEQSMDFCKCYGFGMYLGDDDLAYMQDSADQGREFSGPLPGNAPKPLHSHKLVEFKRANHSFASVINGLSYEIRESEGIAIIDGFPYEILDDKDIAALDEDEEMLENENDYDQRADEVVSEDENPLFVSERKDTRLPATEPLQLNPGAPVFTPFQPGPPSNPNPFAPVGTFGKPSSSNSAQQSLFSQPSPLSHTSKFGLPSGSSTAASVDSLSTVSNAQQRPETSTIIPPATALSNIEKQTGLESEKSATRLSFSGQANQSGGSGTPPKDFTWKANQPINFGFAPSTTTPSTSQSSPSLNLTGALANSGGSIAPNRFSSLFNDQVTTSKTSTSTSSLAPSPLTSSSTPALSQSAVSVLSLSSTIASTSQGAGSSLFDRVEYPTLKPSSQTNFTGLNPSGQTANNIFPPPAVTVSGTPSPSSAHGQNSGPDSKSIANNISTTQSASLFNNDSLHNPLQKPTSPFPPQPAVTQQPRPATAESSQSGSGIAAQSAKASQLFSSSDLIPSITISKPSPPPIPSPRQGGLQNSSSTSVLAQPLSAPNANGFPTAVPATPRVNGHAFDLPVPPIVMSPRKERVNSLYDVITHNTMLKGGDGTNGGLLKQFIEHTIFQIVQEEQRRIMDEKSKEYADDFRRNTLRRKYGMRWYRITYQAKKRREGRERRKQMAAALLRKRGKVEQNKTPHLSVEEEYAAFILTQQQKRSEAGSSQASHTSSPREDISHKEDEFGRSMLSLGGSTAQKPSRTSIRDQRRARTQLSATPEASYRVHKRNSVSSVSSSISSKISRPDYRFLSFDSILENPSEVKRLSTMKSNYFRLKAAGVDVMSDWNNLRSADDLPSKLSLLTLPKLKRRRSIDDDAGRDLPKRYSPPRTSPPGRHSLDMASSPFRSKYVQSLLHERSEDQTRHSRSGSLSSDTQAVIAQAQAAMAGLRDDLKEMRDEIDEWSRSESEGGRRPPASALDHNMNASSGLNGSLHGQDKRKLPKFWGRVSSFVPRAEYGIKPKERNDQTTVKYLGTPTRPSPVSNGSPAAPLSGINAAPPVMLFSDPADDAAKGGTSLEDAIEL